MEDGCHIVWDPGIEDQEVTMSKRLAHFLSYVSGSNDVLISSTEEEWEGPDKMDMSGSRTELDTHATHASGGIRMLCDSQHWKEGGGSSIQTGLRTEGNPNCACSSTI